MVLLFEELAKGASVTVLENKGRIIGVLLSNLIQNKQLVKDQRSALGHWKENIRERIQILISRVLGKIHCGRKLRLKAGGRGKAKKQIPFRTILAHNTAENLVLSNHPERSSCVKRSIVHPMTPQKKGSGNE